MLQNQRPLHWLTKPEPRRCDGVLERSKRSGLPHGNQKVEVMSLNAQLTLWVPGSRIDASRMGSSRSRWLAWRSRGAIQTRASATSRENREKRLRSKLRQGFEKRAFNGEPDSWRGIWVFRFRSVYKAEASSATGTTIRAAGAQQVCHCVCEGKAEGRQAHIVGSHCSQATACTKTSKATLSSGGIGSSICALGRRGQFALSFLTRAFPPRRSLLCLLLKTAAQATQLLPVVSFRA